MGQGTSSRPLFLKKALLEVKVSGLELSFHTPQIGIK